jgi:predicted negative regulator of RcsB-dependent stress response
MTFKTIKIILFIVLLVLVGVGSVFGYQYYLQKKADIKRTELREQREGEAQEQKNEVTEIPAGTGEAPKTESPVPAGLKGPAPLPN